MSMFNRASFPLDPSKIDEANSVSYLQRMLNFGLLVNDTIAWIRWVSNTCWFSRCLGDSWVSRFRKSQTTPPLRVVENLWFWGVDRHLLQPQFQQLQILCPCFTFANMLKLLLLKSIGQMIWENWRCPRQPHLPYVQVQFEVSDGISRVG